MSAFDAGSGLNGSALHTAIIGFTMVAAIAWAGWVVFRSGKLHANRRISETALLMTILQVFVLIVVLAIMILSM